MVALRSWQSNLLPVNWFGGIDAAEGCRQLPGGTSRSHQPAYHRWRTMPSRQSPRCRICRWKLTAGYRSRGRNVHPRGPAASCMQPAASLGLLVAVRAREGVSTLKLYSRLSGNMKVPVLPKSLPLGRSAATPTSDCPVMPRPQQSKLGQGWSHSDTNVHGATPHEQETVHHSPLSQIVGDTYAMCQIRRRGKRKLRTAQMGCWRPRATP